MKVGCATASQARRRSHNDAAATPLRRRTLRGSAVHLNSLVAWIRRPMEVDPVGHKQDGSCALPDRLEPLCFSACVEQCDSVAMLRETGGPVTHPLAGKRRDEGDET